MRADVTYRLLSLEFRGMKPRAMFNGAEILHDRGSRVAEIVNLRTPRAKVQGYLREINGREVLSVRYQIIARDPRTGRRLAPPVAFCHPFPRGTNVRLVYEPRGVLTLVRDGGKRFFSDNFWLAERLNDKTLPRQSVFQFHE